MITVAQRIRAYPPNVRAKFVGDPAEWLPQPVTMHGAHEFHSIVSTWPTALLLDINVGGVWTRGYAATRRVEITAPSRPDPGVAVFDLITGQLTAISDTDGVRLVLRVKVVRRHRGWARLVPASLQARVLAKDVLRRIARQLTVDPPPVAPSRAGRPSKR